MCFSNFAAAILFALAAALAHGSAWAFDDNAIASSLVQRGFSAQFSADIERLLNDNRALIVRAEIPNEPGYRLTVVPVSPITDAKGMDALVSMGSLLPQRSAKALGLPEVLNESTYEATLDRLFDSADIDIWLRNADQSEMTAKQKDRYRERLAEDRTRYTERLQKYKAGPNGAEILSTFFAMYNDGKKTITFESRESYRRLLVASLSIASALYASADERAKLAPLVMTQIGEYILLTDIKTKTVIQVGIGSLKYLAPAESAIRNNINLTNIGAMNTLYDVSNAAIPTIGRLNERLLNTGKLQIKNAQKEEEVALKEEKLVRKEEYLAQTKQEVAQTKQEVAQTKQEVAQTKQEVAIMKDALRLSNEIKALVLKYKENPSNTKLLSQLMEKVELINLVENRLSVYEDGVDSGLDKAKLLIKITLAYYRNEIR